MSEISVVAPASRRRWLILAAVGCAAIVLVLLVSALVIVDKKHFGWLVGSAFLGTTVIGAMVGGLLILVAAWNLPERWKWQGILLMVWALIALTSPAFGWLFLMPWGVLLLLLPFVVWAFVTLFRR